MMTIQKSNEWDGETEEKEKENNSWSHQSVKDKT